MTLIPSFLIGCASGLRSMSPLAVIGVLRRPRPAPTGRSATSIIDSRAVKIGLVGLAVAEAAGDKLPFAPDRIVPLGIAARIATGGLAGAALAPRDQRAIAALLGATGAVAAAYVSFGLRKRAMSRFGQASTGLIEDAVALGASLWLARATRG